MNRADLLAKGFVQRPDGSWYKRSRRSGAVGAVEAEVSEPAPSQALARPARERKSRARSAGRVPLAVVVLVALRLRLLDDDNNVASLKPLRDAVAESLGVDDGDARVRWEYGQQRTDGEEGVVVKVEVLAK